MEKVGSYIIDPESGELQPNLKDEAMAERHKKTEKEISEPAASEVKSGNSKK